MRAYLTAQTGPDPITGLPATRAAGQWPGQASFGRTMALLYIITTLAFVSALFLISATMNTLIAEQAREIAILKTLGGRRRQIGGITVRTAAMLGAAGAILGTLLGIAVAYLVAHSFAETLIDLPIGFGVAPGVVVASLLAGPVLAVAASLPALRRALRRPVAETLTGADSAGGFGAGWLDRLVARSGLLAEAGVPEQPADGRPERAPPEAAQPGHHRPDRGGRRAGHHVPGPGPVGVGPDQPHGEPAAVQRRGRHGQRLAAVRRPGGRHRRRDAGDQPGPNRWRPSAVQYRGQTYVGWGLGPHPLYAYRLERGPLVHRGRGGRERPPGHPAGGARPGAGPHQPRVHRPGS